MHCPFQYQGQAYRKKKIIRIDTIASLGIKIIIIQSVILTQSNAIKTL